MLRSVRLVLGLFAEGKSGLLVSLCDGVDAQVCFQTLRIVLVDALCHGRVACGCDAS